MTAVSDSSPLADEKAAAAIPSISTMKLKTVYGSVRLAAGMRSAARYATSSTAREAR